MSFYRRFKLQGANFDEAQPNLYLHVHTLDI